MRDTAAGLLIGALGGLVCWLSAFPRHGSPAA